MKNRVITAMLVISITLLIILACFGLKLGKFQVLSLSQLKSENEQLDEKITKASTLTATEYPDNIDTLEKTYDQYKITKEKYEELSGFTETEDKKDVYETKKYDIGYLWKIIGKYATTYNIGIEMNIEKSSGDLYDLNFSVSGTYVNISEFISKLENNSDLSFRIYNFKMSGTGKTVTATFKVKNVNIDSSTITTVSSSQTANTTDNADVSSAN